MKQEHPADTSFLNQFLGAHHSRIEAHLQRHLGGLFWEQRQRLQNFAAFLGSGRERLVAIHMLSRPQRPQHEILVEHIGRADAHNVDVGIADNALGIGGGIGKALHLPGLLSHAGHRVADALQPDGKGQIGVVQGNGFIAVRMRLSHKAVSDNAHMIFPHDVPPSNHTISRHRSRTGVSDR